jgi:hydroxymethylpyrimidine/phosphomethylpyrimidine kinase
MTDAQQKAASQPIALTIAGSDSSGGAGIQADLKTFAALGVYGASIITALTAQNTTGVTGIHDVPPEFVAAQIDAVFSDLDIAAVKIGMVSQAATIEAIVAGLDRWKPRYVVLDPVMVATSGAHLLAKSAVDLLRTQLLPRATIVTPNLPEAGALLGAPVATDRAEIERQARDLLRLGAHAVLIKGGHGEGAESIDYLVTSATIKAFSAPRIATRNTHGTGCTLSSAIAAGLAKGMALEAAVDAAKRYVTAAIAAADTLAVGRGHGPLQHFHAFMPAHLSAERKT